MREYRRKIKGQYQIVKNNIPLCCNNDTNFTSELLNIEIQYLADLVWYRRWSKKIVNELRLDDRY